MDSAEALAVLVSDAGVPERLEAARVLERAARHEDVDLIKARLRVERDELVGRVLQRALEWAESQGEEDDGSGEDSTPERVRAQVRSETIHMFLHETEKVVGKLELVARASIPDFEGSPVSESIRELVAVLDCFNELRDAAQVADLEEVNLTDLVTSIVATEINDHEGAAIRWPDATSRADEPDKDLDIVSVLLSRDDPVPTSGYPRLLKLALSNALRNAIEACQESGGDSPRVVVTWGADPDSGWVSLLDTGPGLPADIHSIWRPGVSTKPSSTSGRGFGLAIVSQAAESMNAGVSLRDSTAGGARFSIEWSTVRHR